MNRRDVLSEAFAALAAHRLRATLSSVGIVVGVATVVTALAIGEGARREAIAEIGALGINNVLVRSVRPDDAPVDQDERPAPLLTVADAEAIQQTVSGLRAVAPLRVARGEIGAGGRRVTSTIIGAVVAWDRVIDAPMAAGRWLKSSDVEERRRVAVIGGDLAAALFGQGDPTGSYVRASGNWYTVVGVLDAESQVGARRSSIQWFDPANSLIVPITAMDIRLGRGDSVDRVNEIAIRAADPQNVEATAEIAARVLQNRRTDPTSFEIVVPRALLEARLRAQRTFNGVLLGVGGLALLISGVGIMNIMLASVAERTHEIGVRRAFGARQSEVVAQFAAEASLLCLAGGGIGIPVGVLLSTIVAWLARWPVSVSPAAVGLALVLAAGVGLLFGIYPAKVAARLDPVAALRAE